ncbi:DUF6262 family protein [Mycobacterium sp.]|uniref:DUF6262 family protein n=1 Tax=Mycobacterium sp. TaxID=1785 RepID=UPI003BADAE0F
MTPNQQPDAKRWDALVESRRQDSEHKRRAVEQALSAMQRDGDIVTIASVARRAGVSRGLIYNDPGLKQAVVEARTRQEAITPAAPCLQPRSVVSHRDLINALALAKHDLVDLRRENTALRKRLGLTIGSELDASLGDTHPQTLQSLRERLTDLEAELIEERRRRETLAAENQDLREDLDAQRENFRNLMAKLNRT